MEKSISELIATLRESISRSDNNLANETTLALFEAIQSRFLNDAAKDKAAVDDLAKRLDNIATTLTRTGIRDPLDHDGDGRKGGSLPKTRRKTR